MNKKKVAVAAVSVVMAGTMVFSITGCNKPTPPPVDTTIDIIEYEAGTTVKTSLGYSTTKTTGISFASDETLPLVNADGSEATTSIKLPDGKEYQKGALKPMWAAYEDALNIKISDNWTVANDNLNECVQKGLSNYDLIGAGNLTTIQTQIDAKSLLDLSKYMKSMPNLRKFLNDNALAELGTLSNAETGAIYYAPYYAGMNDAERYNMFRKDYVSELLDHADLSQAATKNGGTITFKAQAEAKKSNNLGNRKQNETYDGTKSSVTAYMGTKGNYIVETTNPHDTLKTIFVKVDYDAALAAAKDSSSDLGKALTAAGVTNLSSLTSGNIVDLQNAAINATNGEVKGEHFLTILRAYIDVAYKWAATKDASTWNKMYGAEVNGETTKRSDVFNATYAAWDVDLYAAIGRVFVTCGNLLGSHQAQTSADTNYGASTWLFVPRTGWTNRTTRLTAMIGELYGVRGMEGMTYLDSSGNLRQTRFNVSTWDALTRFSAFHTEGLVPSFNKDDAGAEIGTVGSVSTNSVYDGTGTHFQGLSTNDFIHTQTTLGTHEYANKTNVQTTDGYIWTGVATPVSRWLTTDESTVDSNDTVITNDVALADRPDSKCTIMRFTESALKLKTGGLVIPAAIESDTNRLGATLALLDYIYSNDGLIETSFGTRSDTDNLTGTDANGYTTTNNGWWYGEPVKTLNIDGKNTNIENMSMEELYNKGVVETHDNGKQYTMTAEYQGYALVYKNKLYRTGTVGADTAYPNGYVYNGVMTPYFTQAVRKLCEGKIAVNGYKHTSAAWSSTNLQNLVLGQEGFGIVNNAGMVQLCGDMAVQGFDVISVTLGNGSAKTVSQAITDNPWYTCAPSITLPQTASNIINGYTSFSKQLFSTGGDKATYFILEVGWYGNNASVAGYDVSDITDADLGSPAKVAAKLKSIATQVESLNNQTWSELYDYYVKKQANK
ncbi:MAG: hypothetical protein K2L12_05360 [Clostridia bacterium]|nr:hypothetical protein [Clostridia bacterium]